MKWRRFSIAVCLLVSAHLAPAFAEDCPVAKAIKAEDSSNGIRTWNGLHKSYVLYKACDDGSIAGGYSDAVNGLVVNHWDSLLSVKASIQADLKFAAFIVRHIGESWPREDLVTAKSLALNRCPAGLELFCGSVIKRLSELDAIESQ